MNARARLAGVAVLGVTLCCVPQAAAYDRAEQFEYVRDKHTVDATVEALVGAELHDAFWLTHPMREFEPAHRWAARLLADVPGKKKSLVLVTGDVPPEKWVRNPPFLATGAPPAPEPWRRRLSDVGAYW